jgi:hypothetical protein
MQKRISLFLAIAMLFLVSCGESGRKDQITGEWKLTQLKVGEDTFELTDCDNQTVWNFTSESAEPLGDGTAVQVLTATAPDDCKWFGFDAKWTVTDGKVFISTSRIGGMGGISIAGTMDILELSDSKMVLQSMDKVLTFEK